MIKTLPTCPFVMVYKPFSNCATPDFAMDRHQNHIAAGSGSATSLEPAVVALQLLTPGAKTRGAVHDDLNGAFNDSQPHDATPDIRSSLGPTPSEAASLQAIGFSKPRRVAVIATLASISFLNTMGSGILIAALPRIADELGLTESLILWPAAVYALAAGCLLLIFGAVADVVGSKLMWLTGSYLFMAFTLGVGLARTGIQLILLRTLLGASISMCLPTAVSLIANTFPKGSWRNVAFAMNGMGSPLGYALGLVLGGIFTDTIGWRWAYYMSAIINFCLSTCAIWSLPSVPTRSEQAWTARLAHEIDWVGAMSMSVALGMLLYVLAMVSSSYKRLDSPANIALLSISLALLVAFPFWMDRQVKLGRPALIPNSLWRNSSFTSVCIAVFLCWASLNGIEYFTTLYFQKIQGLSALQSSLRFLPHVIMGVAVNIITAMIIS
ncbi:hypothetical protein QQX98_001448 [Neonectria punicea]|uniref:Major facilitator superfamily (MFS) profile domain-containing protein n=1 Tax=Neonectria punicea TaxID=979145 RepID=A0ABR1HP67_9HYPO